MSETKQNESVEIFQQIQTALFHIHSMADMIEDYGLSHDECVADGMSNPIMSMGQMIKEKAEFCLTNIDKSISAS